MGEPRKFWYHNARALLLFGAFFLMIHAGVRIIPQPGDTWRIVLVFYIPGLVSISLAQHGVEEPCRFPALTLALAGLSGIGFGFDGTGMHVIGGVFAALTGVFWMVAVAESMVSWVHDALFAILTVAFGTGIALGYRYVPAATCLWISVAALAAFIMLVAVAHYGRRRSSTELPEGRPS